MCTAAAVAERVPGKPLAPVNLPVPPTSAVPVAAPKPPSVVGVKTPIARLSTSPRASLVNAVVPFDGEPAASKASSSGGASASK